MVQRKSEYRRRKRRTDPLWAERDKAAQRRYYYRHPVRRMLYSARARARDLGIPFEIIEADVEVPQVCPALGIPLRYGPGGRGPDTPSLDRVIPDLGYVPGNVQIISDFANRIKQDATVEQIEAVARWLRAQLERMNPAT